MKVDGSLKSLIQGVSQQPARSRLPGQCTAQDNMSSNPVIGLTRRPPMQEIATLFESVDDAQFYDLDLGDDNKFVVAALPGDLRVFDMDGNEKVVNEVGSTFDYLDGEPLAFTTLDDITYIANRSKVVAMETAVKSYVETGAVVYALGGQYGRVYRLTINWSGTVIAVTYTSPYGGVSTDSGEIATDYIISQLETALNANATFTANFTASRANDVLYIKKTSVPTTETFKVVVGDGNGGDNLLVINNAIKNASELPRYAPHGYVVKVEGASVDADDWYLEFVSEKDSAGALPALGAGFGNNGVWAECVAPQTKYQFDLDTMPHILEYDFGTDEFTFDAAAWENREAGTENSNPDPTFVGRVIEDLAYFQGRLVVLSGPATIMSRTNRTLNFWRNSVTVLADTDVIDVQSTAKGVRSMLRAIPHNRDLVVFANKGQFMVFGRNQITPKNAALVLTTSFQADMTASPVPAGRNIFFAFKFGRFTGIREFFTQDSVDANDSRPITQHVNKYLEGAVTTLTSTSNFDVLFVQTSVGQDTVYFYEYTWINNEKVQSSWSRWNMSDPVVFTFINESEVSMITKRDNNYILNKIDLDSQNDTGLTFNVRLDRKKILPAVSTTVVAPYDVPVDDPDDIIFVQGDGCPTPGLRAWVDSYDAGTDTYTFDRDMEGGEVIYGIPYRSSYIPTNPDVKDQEGVRISTGKLKVSKFILNCKETGKLFTRVFSKYFSDVNQEFTARVLGDPDNVVGSPVVSDSAYIVPFRQNVSHAELEIYSEHYLPFTINDIQWKGQYTKQGTRIANRGQQ